jgi:hypothetical protein
MIDARKPLGLCMHCIDSLWWLAACWCVQAENELLKVHQMQLLEKEHSGCAALLRDDKVGGWLGGWAGGWEAGWEAGRRAGIAAAVLQPCCCCCTWKVVFILEGCARQGCCCRPFPASQPASAACSQPCCKAALSALFLTTCAVTVTPCAVASLPVLTVLPPVLPPVPQKADLARMYRMFNRLPKGLDPMADIFRKHVEAEGG